MSSPIPILCLYHEYRHLYTDTYTGIGTTLSYLTSLHGLNGRHLAQTLVEGYYCLLGSGVDSLVVALTSVDITHFFKIRLPATRGGVEEHERVLEVVWHHRVAVHRIMDVPTVGNHHYTALA